MKLNTVILLIVTIITIPLLSASISSAYYYPTTNINMERITMREAKQIALNHVGLTEDKVFFIKAETDFDDHEYEIEFIAGDIKHEFTIWFNGQIKKYKQKHYLW